MDVRDFSFFYGSRQVLKKLNFTIERKSVTAIIGPSGCGKSTFLRSINRLNDLIPGVRHEGDILVEGTSVFSHGTDLVALRQRVGMVFQRPNPFPKSVFDNVAYGPALNRLVTRRDLPDLVERCLRQAALWDEVKDRLDESGAGLSGGQQQRLCIARALGNQPEVLLMDEPCSALDPIATQKVEELIFELKKHYTIVIVTHNMQQAARVSDYTGFFDRGRADRVRRDRADLHVARARAHGSLYYREIRMSVDVHRHFHDELSHVKVRLLTMSGEAEAALGLAVEALLERDGEKAGRVIAGRPGDRQHGGRDRGAVHQPPRPPAADGARPPDAHLGAQDRQRPRAGRRSRGQHRPVARSG